MRHRLCCVFSLLWADSNAPAADPSPLLLSAAPSLGFLLPTLSGPFVVPRLRWPLRSWTSSTFSFFSCACSLRRVRSSFCATWSLPPASTFAYDGKDCPRAHHAPAAAAACTWGWVLACYTRGVWVAEEEWAVVTILLPPPPRGAWVATGGGRPAVSHGVLCPSPPSVRPPVPDKTLRIPWDPLAPPITQRHA